jgi:hypothetical protein
MTDHPITPPPELVQQWYQEANLSGAPYEYEQHIATRGAQWGYEQCGEVNEAKLQKARDQELEACCDWLRYEDVFGEELALKLRTARRPKPSLKELALMALEDGDTGPGASLTLTEVSIIRRALEALPE